MRTAAPGDEVFVEYEGILENGEVFDSTKDSGTLHFVIGTGSVMPLFEESVIGMKDGEQHEITMQPDDAFGHRQEELVQTIDRATFGERSSEVKVGTVLNLKTEKDGQPHTVPALVTEVGEETITLDYNHPLAGQNILYKLTLVKIGDKKTNLTPVAPQDGA